MAKIINLTNDVIAEIKREFDELLCSAKIPDGKLTFTKNLGTVNRKARLFFDERAWQKMNTLVREFSSEVAWHGTAKRGENDDYIISDIIVYPQEVTGATVNTDQTEYEKWLMTLDDENFNNLRMQGHSHVNMSTTPSSVDISHQERILDQLENNMFYIFLIWNKRGEKTIKIYDLAKNILFETADVEVRIIREENGLEEFLESAKKAVKTKTYGTSFTTGTNYTAGTAFTANKGSESTLFDSIVMTTKKKPDEPKKRKGKPVKYDWRK